MNLTVPGIERWRKLMRADSPDGQEAPSSARYSLRVRSFVSGVVGLVSAIGCYQARLIIYPGPGDFLWALRSARDLLAGHDPYSYPVNALAVPYPLPAAFVGMPFVWLPDTLAAAIFFGFSSGLLAFGLLRTGHAWRLCLFLTPLYLYGLLFAQWPPVLMAMAFFPSLLFLILVKPNMVLPVALSGYARWTWRGVVLSCIIGLSSLLVMPDWPLRFLSQLGPYEGVIPLLVISGGGPLILLALPFWRDKAARLLLLMSLMPQRMFYDQLTLWLIPRSAAEMVIMIAASWVGAFAWFSTLNWQQWTVLSIYLPALALVLWKHVGQRARQTAASPFRWISRRTEGTVLPKKRPAD